MLTMSSHARPHIFNIIFDVWTKYTVWLITHYIPSFFACAFILLIQTGVDMVYWKLFFYVTPQRQRWTWMKVHFLRILLINYSYLQGIFLRLLLLSNINKYLFWRYLYILKIFIVIQFTDMWDYEKQISTYARKKKTARKAIPLFVE